eukprot:gene9833-2026_t
MLPPDKQYTFLLRRAEQLSQNNGMGWMQEYSSFARFHSQPTRIASTEANQMLNRYCNILPYDHSRVTVQPQHSNGNNDYINANFVPSYGKVAYIATQGPVPASFNAFWQMIWEQKIEIIAMVTNEIEGGKLKCHRYWPEDTQQQGMYGSLEVVLGPKKDKSNHITRHMLIRNHATKEERELVHFLYTAWPDHGVPNTANELLVFRKAINKECRGGMARVLVHCSAGVGRTGTYIAVDTLIRQLEAKVDPIDPCLVVTEMRKNRAFLVQTLVQYQFIFKAILEIIAKYRHRAKKVLHQHQDAQQSKEEQQFDQMQEIQDQVTAVEDDIVNLATIDEEVERELLKEQGIHEPSMVDARASEKIDDKDVAKSVSHSQRLESLMTYVTSDDWRASLQDKRSLGYQVPAAPLESRLKSLAQNMQVVNEAWKQHYSAISETWTIQQAQGGEEYDVTKTFNPIQSRILALAQQRQAWKFKPKEVREELEREHQATLESLHSRFKKLDEYMRSSERRWRERGDGLHGDEIIDRRRDTSDLIGGLHERLQRLVSERDAWKTRGDGFRGVIDKPIHNPKTESSPEIQPKSSVEETEADNEVSQKIDQMSLEEPTEMEVIKGEDFHVDKKPHKFLTLRQAKKKDQESHPMRLYWEIFDIHLLLCQYPQLITIDALLSPHLLFKLRQTCDWISHLEAILKPSSSLEIDRLVQGAG